ELKRAQIEFIKKNSWKTRYRQQGGQCKYCDQCTSELICGRFIVGNNDIILMTKLINSAVKDPRISPETIVLQAIRLGI
ncbi:hypothetical protein LSH36_881g00000, partial [Paralvinella palmiformis]